MERITDERIEYLANETSERTSGIYDCGEIRELARLLLEELKQPKVWDCAPEWAIQANVWYHDASDDDADEDNCKTYFRDLPKSPEREIAEKLVSEQMSVIGYMLTPQEKTELINLSESAINEYKALKAQRKGTMTAICIASIIISILNIILVLSGRHDGR